MTEADDQLIAHLMTEHEALRLEKALRDALFHMSPNAPPTARNETTEALRLLGEIRGRSA